MPPHADSIINNAFYKAKQSGKNVFVMFHASWCGWCRKMDTAMSDPVCKNLFDDNYIITHLTINEVAGKKNLENPGAAELYQKHAPKSSGIPFWLIYNANGKLLADAKMPDGSNSGCPATENEVTHFINALQKSSGIKDSDLKIIYERFRKNE